MEVVSLSTNGLQLMPGGSFSNQEPDQLSDRSSQFEEENRHGESEKAGVIQQDYVEEEEEQDDEEQEEQDDEELEEQNDEVEEEQDVEGQEKDSFVVEQDEDD